MSEPKDKVILALDVPSAARASSLVQACGDDLLWVKIGLELFVAEGPRMVQLLKNQNKRIFLDLKLHDIPNTVAGAVRSAARMGVDLLTVHAAGGPEMMRAAAEAREGQRPRLLGVTVLTSLRGDEFPEVYRSGDVAERVDVFARSAHAAGLDGVVCSAREVARLAAALPPDFLRVTPGIRPPGEDAHDQARTATPGEALAAGATHLVVGRAVSQAGRPRFALRQILDAVAGAGA